MVSLLGELAAGADQFEALRRVMGIMHRALTDDPSPAGGFAGFLKEFAAEHSDALPDDVSFLSGLGDDTESLMKELAKFAQ